MEQHLFGAASSHDAGEINRKLAGIVASAIDGIVTVDEQQRITLFNPAAETMFGLPVDQALGENISRFIPQRYWTAHNAHMGRFAEANMPPRHFGTLDAISGVRIDGQEFPIEASISEAEVGGERLTTVILRDIAQRIASEKALQLVTREIDHRAKNALAVVQALVSQTRAPTIEAFVAAVRGRVAALGRAHSLLAKNRWEGAELATIIAEETGPYQMQDRIRIQGPSVTLGPDAVQPISMLIHELATNAVKYGALSSERGQVEIELKVLPAGELELLWTETGGPRVHEPTATGFGFTLITGLASRQLGGSAQMLWPPEGARLSLLLPPSVFHLPTAPRPGAAAATSADRHDSLAGGRVLVVEDDLLVALELCDDLRSRGWTVMGPAATVDEAESALIALPLPDLAVLDVNLRGELIYPVADRLRELGVPFIFCTGYEEVDSRFNGSPIVRKPINVGALDDELRRIRLPAPDARLVN